MILGIFVALILIFVVLPLVGFAIWWVVSTAVVGLFFGALGRLIIPGRQPIGALATIVCGLLGSFVGSLIGRAVWSAHTHHLATLLIEIGVSAVAVLAVSANTRRQVRTGGPHRVIDV